MLRRTGFKRKGAPPVVRDADRVRPTPTPSAAFRLGVPVADQAAMPKTEPQRNPFLLTMARGERCLLRVPGICCNDPATTVAAHSNWAEHGKSGARKADDCYHVWACFACHSWLDQGPAPAEEKRCRWDAAFTWMRSIWLDIVAGMQQATPKERAAAQWALDNIHQKKC